MPNLTPHEYVEQRHFEIQERAQAGSLVCGTCVTDWHLWAGVKGFAENDTCTFCGAKGQCVTFDDLYGPIANALSNLYVTVDESGAHHEDGDWNVPTHDVGEILEYELLHDAVDDQVISSLVAYMAGKNAVDYGFVRRRDVWASLYDSDEGSWRYFMAQARDGRVKAASKDILKQLPDELLDLFNRIERYAQIQGLYKSGSPTLWRGRPGKLENNFRTGKEIGSAPAIYAASGRLNVKGQSVFYGSTKLHGAIIELANHHGPDVELWCGRFAPSRSLYHLDVMTVPESPSPFAPDAAETFDAISFLIRFAKTLREPKPLRASDEEDHDYRARLDKHYLPTQIFAAFLVGTHEDIRPDAIKYGSSLDATSENWVVFADHHHCGEFDRPSMPDDGVCLLLDRQTVAFVAARDYLGADSTSDGDDL